MTTETQRNFLGIPISGDITPSRRNTAQKSKEEFAEIMQPILDDPTIIAFGWHQFTPYFNDGDECVFSAYGAWFYTQPPAPEPVVERPYEERLIQAVIDQFPFAHILTATNVPTMIAEAFKRVPPVDLAGAIAERDRMLVNDFAKRLELLSTVMLPQSSAVGVLQEVLAALDNPQPEPEDEFDPDDIDYRYRLDDGDKHGLGEMKHTGWGILPDGTRGWLDEHYEGPDEARYRRCEKLDSAIQSGAFDNVLLDLFGDHAGITVRKSGITVEEYSHD